MIYKLPTTGRTANPYRGAYPDRIASASIGRGIVHVETNVGNRYVALYADMPDLNCKVLGRGFGEVFGVTTFAATPMSLVDYVGVLTAITVVRRLRARKAA